MLRTALTAIAASLAALGAAASPASAVDTCAYDAGTRVVTATFGSDTESTLSVNGGAISSESGACGAATVTNTDTIVVAGDATNEKLTIDLSGGAFAPGFSTEADGSPEIELQVNLAGNNSCMTIQGGGAAEHVTAGAGTASEQLAVNLNANEAADDVDLVVPNAGTPYCAHLRGGADDDVLRLTGGDGTGPSVDGDVWGEADDDTLSGSSEVDGGPGDDDVSSDYIMYASPGDDHFTALAAGAVLTYAAAPAGVEVVLPGGTAPGKDGHGATDTYTDVRKIDGTAHADDVTGSLANEEINALSGANDVDGAGGNDHVRGTGVLRGGTGHDTIELISGTGYGDAGADSLAGAGTMYGGPDNDFFGQGDLFLGTQAPNGAAQMHGGDGRDTVAYGDNSWQWYQQPYGRFDDVRVTFDGVADDGEIAANEQDNVMPDVENAIGGLGDDVLIGDGEANYLNGLSGADEIRGAGGADDLRSVSNPSIGWDVQNDLIEGGSGPDKILSHGGADTILARDGEADTVTECGAKSDGGEADSLDTIASDCESIVRADPDPGSGGGGGGGGGPQDPAPADPGPPAGPPPGGTGGPAPGPTPAPAAEERLAGQSASQIAGAFGLPATRSCQSRRRFPIRLREPSGVKIASAVVRVGSRRSTAKFTRGRWRAVVDLRGLPKGKVTIRIEVTTASGRKLVGKRSYRTCATKRRSGRVRDI